MSCGLTVIEAVDVDGRSVGLSCHWLVDSASDTAGDVETVESKEFVDLLPGCFSGSCSLDVHGIASSIIECKLSITSSDSTANS